MRRQVLTRNLIPLDGEEEFSDYLIEIGDGSVEIADGEDTIEPRPQSARTPRYSTALSAPSGRMYSQI